MTQNLSSHIQGVEPIIAVWSHLARFESLASICAGHACQRGFEMFIPVDLGRPRIAHERCSGAVSVTGLQACRPGTARIIKGGILNEVLHINTGLSSRTGAQLGTTNIRVAPVSAIWFSPSRRDEGSHGQCLTNLKMYAALIGICCMIALITSWID